MIIEILVIVGSFLRPGVNSRKLELSIVIDENIFWSNISNLLFFLMKLFSDIRKTVQQIPNLSFLKFVQANLLSISNLISQSVRVIVIFNLI